MPEMLFAVHLLAVASGDGAMTWQNEKGRVDAALVQDVTADNATSLEVRSVMTPQSITVAFSSGAAGTVIGI